MGKTIYIQCYEGLSAKMMVEALLNLMPEQTQAKATVDQLLALNCPAEVKAAMIRKLPRKIKDFALPEGAEELFLRAYDIWLHAKAAVQRVNIAHVEFQEKDYDEVIAMLAASICMERLEADTIICPIVYDGYGQIYIDHEPVSVPLPETLYILMGAEIAMHRMEHDSAWVTPEGAAFLAACRTSDHLPEEYHVSKIGTGRGIASDGSNGVLRIMVLEEKNAENSETTDFSEKEAVEKKIEADFPEKEAEQEIILKEISDFEEKMAEPVTEATERSTNWDDDLEFLEESIIRQVAPEKEPDEIQTEEPQTDTLEESKEVCPEELNNESSEETEDSLPEMKETEIEDEPLLETKMPEDEPLPESETVAEDIVCTDTTTPDEIWKLECNIDDCGGEVLGYTMERLMENGALDACYLPIYMKKNRPAYMLTVLCRPEDRERLEDIIFEETTTIGIRRALMQRTILQRKKSTEQTSLGDVAVKTMKKKNGEVPTLEYESVAAIAREQHLPFREVYRRLEKELY